MTQEDPGWLPSLRGLPWYWIPVVGSVMRVKARQRETNGLIFLRSVFLGLIVALLLFVVALSFIGPWDGGDEGWVPWAVVAIGIASLAYVARIRRRPLPTNSREALARSYRALFFIGVGVAEAAALWGIAGVFLGGSLWIYLVGLPFGLVGLWMIAPTRTDIERRQREITAAGSPLSLLDALISVPTP
jgi:F0F1-type ATP synthase membrane subunit c/vacuolar-type H+-ATPase subunit K